ncbi:MAG: DUF928 domain-containing protein, partial [Cyanobacteria bacterium J06639_1]
APLEPDRSYLWTLLIQCDPDRLSGMNYVSGTVHHAPPSLELEADLATLSAPERAAAYARAGYWYDALTEVEGLYRSDRENPAYAAAWRHFLQQVELDPDVVPDSLHSANVRAQSSRTFGIADWGR